MRRDECAILVDYLLGRARATLRNCVDKRLMKKTGHSYQLNPMANRSLREASHREILVLETGEIQAIRG